MNIFKKLFSKKQTPDREYREELLKEKEEFTAKGEPWVGILSMDIDPIDIHNGAFELDFNDKFVARLMKFGYQGKTDQDIVDQWFQEVCRHVVLETWEQEQAMNPSRFHNKRDIGDGRSEIS